MAVRDGTGTVALASAERYNPACKLFFSSQSTYIEFDGRHDGFTWS